MITREEKYKEIQDSITKEEKLNKFKKISKIFITIIVTLTAILLLGMYVGAKIVVVDEYKIVSNIPSTFHGMKIVHISDILYNSINQNDLDKIKDQINEIEPDVIIFTGNLIKDNIEIEENDINVLKNFFKDINAKLDKYAVTGKYDTETFNIVMDNNFKILNNKSELLYYKDTTPLEFIGFNSLELDLSEIKESDNYKICLLSNPDKLDEIKDTIKCNLAFAGDTLGGEIKIFDKPILDNHKYNSNYQEIDNTKLYISSGLGNTINVRYFNHPTINLYRLTTY